MIPFCIVIPMDYDTQLNKPAIEEALVEVAAARQMTAQVSYINSGYTAFGWRWYPWLPMQTLKGVGLCQVAIVAGIGGFAAAYYTEGYAVLGGWTFWAISFGDESIMPRNYPYWGIYLNRRSQMGAVLHELDHLLCRCRDLGHERGMPWENLFSAKQ